MKTRTRRQLGFLLGFGLYFVGLWFLWDTAVVYPIKIFVVLLHEASHAAALLATGGSVDRITLNALQGGVTYGAGGNAFLTLSAGYLGSLAWGALFVLLARSRRIGAGTVLAGVGLLVGILTVVYVRSVFGVVFGLAFGTALFVAGRRLPALWTRRLLVGLGLTSALYAVLDIKSDVLDRPHLPSDAAMLADLTGIPTVVWGVAWITVAVAVCALLLRHLWRTA